MTIQIDSGATPAVDEDLGTNGRVRAYAPVTVTVTPASGSAFVETDALAIRWEGVPRGARMSQLLSLRAVLPYDARHISITPAPPHTDVVTAAGVRFRLSPPAPQPRLWQVDAAADRRRRDAGRAYVSDESYSFSERIGREIRFYDGPQLSMSQPNLAVEAMGLRTERYRSYELIGLFLTELWVDTRRVGIVEWTCTWAGHTSLLASLTTPSPRRFETDPRWALTPREGPTREESRRLLAEWQSAERTRPVERR